MTDSLSSSRANEKTDAAQKSSDVSAAPIKAGAGLTSKRFTRYLAELCGTGLAVFVTLVTGALTTMTSDLTLVALSAFAGYAVASYVFGHVSGAHLNPAVTLAAALTGRIGWLDALGYVIAQVIGGILAALAVDPVISSMADWYLTRMQSSGQQSTTSTSKLRTNFWTSVSNGYGSGDGHTMGTNLTGAVILELIASLVIVMVAMRALRSSGIMRKNSWLLIGCAYAAGSVATIAFTGSALNPARATGSAILAAMNGYSGAARQLWVFWVVPLLAGAIVGLVLVICESAKATSAAKSSAQKEDTNAQAASSNEADKSAAAEDAAPAAPVHKSDEERDIHDFNTVIKQDTADDNVEKNDAADGMNIDYVDKNPSTGADDSSDKAHPSQDNDQGKSENKD